MSLIYITVSFFYRQTRCGLRYEPRSATSSSLIEPRFSQLRKLFSCCSSACLLGFTSRDSGCARPRVRWACKATRGSKGSGDRA